MVQVINGDYKSGKTMELIKLSSETKSRIITTEESIETILSKARFLKVSILKPLTMDEFIDQYNSNKPIKEPIVIDNISMFIELFFNKYDIKALTVTTHNN